MEYLIKRESNDPEKAFDIIATVTQYTKAFDIYLNLIENRPECYTCIVNSNNKILLEYDPYNIYDYLKDLNN
jgi:hypothetical protein